MEEKALARAFHAVPSGRNGQGRKGKFEQARGWVVWIVPWGRQHVAIAEGLIGVLWNFENPSARALPTETLGAGMFL